jgi:hypothetical protein
LGGGKKKWHSELLQFRADFDAALAQSEARSNKGSSLTDRRSMLALWHHGLHEELTHDHRFTRKSSRSCFLEPDR